MAGVTSVGWRVDLARDVWDAFAIARENQGDTQLRFHELPADHREAAVLAFTMDGAALGAVLLVFAADGVRD